MADDSSHTLSLGNDEDPSPITDDDFMTDEDFEAWLSGLSASAACSNAPLTALPSRTAVPEVSIGGRTYRPGKSAELHDGTFLRIEQVLRSGSEMFLRGRRLQRLEHMDTLVPEWMNELCWVSDSEAASEDAFQEIPMSEVKRLRIIRFTNQPYTATTLPQAELKQNRMREEEYLYCRMKLQRIRNPSRKSRIVEQALTQLSEEDCDKTFGIDPSTLRYSWRGATASGGTFRRSYYDLTKNEQEIERQYTFGDGFCGAGGVSSGAQQAGLHVSWGFDKDMKAMETYMLNFTGAYGDTCDVSDFLTHLPEDIVVDILHISPPCQTFSPAKTVAASTDAANEACIFSIRELLLKIRPRIVTMEETSGLQERHKEFLYAVISTFVELGYSVRWKLIACEDYGVPQQRKRLVIIGAGPGEPLPQFAAPTHGPPGSGLLPYRTIMDAIGDIPESAPNHDPERAYFRNIVKPPFNPHSFAKTLTCNGGDNYHPSGTRAYTHREAACLQTFPMSHKFCGVGVLKQIGNAVPPMVAKKIFEEIKRELQRVDGVRS